MRTDSFHRGAFLLFLGALLGLILASVLKAEGPVTGTMHWQFSERNTSTFNLCVENRSADTYVVSEAGINRVLMGQVSVISPTERAYRFSRRPRARWIRALSIAGMATTFLMATPAIDINETWIKVAIPVFTGGIQIATPAIEANQRRDFELGVYWPQSMAVAAGGSHCAYVMTGKLERPVSFDVLFADARPLPPEPVSGIVVPEGMGSIPFGMTWDELQSRREKKLPRMPTVVAEAAVPAYWGE